LSPSALKNETKYRGANTKSQSYGADIEHWTVLRRDVALPAAPDGSLPGDREAIARGGDGSV